MHQKPSSCPAIVAAVGWLLMGSLTAHGQAATKAASSAEVVASCEQAARQSLATRNVQPDELTFTGAPSVQPSLAGDSQVVLRGAGRRRGASGVRSFDYSCNVDVNTSQAIGVMLRDTTTQAAEAALSRTPAEPDLRFLSPAACESSAAVALKQRWPFVSQINFDSATRKVTQDSARTAKLQGQGHALPAPGLPATHFEFNCEVDPRDGRVLKMGVSG